MKHSIYKKTAIVYDKLGKEYVRASHKLIPPERIMFAKYFSKGAHILDVGCGGGRDILFFTKKGLQVTGIDLSPVLVAEAKKLVPKSTVYCRNLVTSSLPKNAFDGIWANAILLHLPRADTARAIKRLHDTLKLGGLLHIRVKKGRGEQWVKEKLSQGHARFYTYFSKKEIEGLVKKAGFKIIYSEILPDDGGRKDVTWIAVWGIKK